jgi:hypothetical protein
MPEEVDRHWNIFPPVRGLQFAVLNPGSLCQLRPGIERPGLPQSMPQTFRMCLDPRQELSDCQSLGLQ